MNGATMDDRNRFFNNYSRDNLMFKREHDGELIDKLPPLRSWLYYIKIGAILILMVLACGALEFR